MPEFKVESNAQYLRYKYPNVLPHETVMFDSWLLNTEHEIKSIEHDVLAGKGEQAPGTMPDYMRKMTKRLTQKRIDLIFRTEQDLVIAEIKPRAQHSVLGQLLTYKYLYKQEHDVTMPIRLLAISEAVAPDMQGVYSKYGIELDIVIPLLAEITHIRTKYGVNHLKQFERSRKLTYHK